MWSDRFYVRILKLFVFLWELNTFHGKGLFAISLLGFYKSPIPRFFDLSLAEKRYCYCFIFTFLSSYLGNSAGIWPVCQSCPIHLEFIHILCCIPNFIYSLYKCSRLFYTLISLVSFIRATIFRRWILPFSYSFYVIMLKSAHIVERIFHRFWNAFLFFPFFLRVEHISLKGYFQLYPFEGSISILNLWKSILFKNYF